jgi:ligand-binding sensor domain-containing protein
MLEVCLFLALACLCSAAFDSGRTIAQFAHTAWGPKDGAPSPVAALAQSKDGYLWLGGPEGLYRIPNCTSGKRETVDGRNDKVSQPNPTIG